MIKITMGHMIIQQAQRMTPIYSIGYEAVQQWKAMLIGDKNK